MILPLWKVSSRIRQQKDKNDFMALCPETRIRQMQLAAEKAGHKIICAGFLNAIIYRCYL